MSDPLKGCSWRYVKRNIACLDPSHFIEDMFMGILQAQWSTIRWSLWFDLGCVSPTLEVNIHLQSPLGQPIALSVPHCATQGESPWSILWHPGRPQKTRQGLHQILVTSNRFITICYIYCKYQNIQSHHKHNQFSSKSIIDIFTNFESDWSNTPSIRV